MRDTRDTVLPKTFLSVKKIAFVFVSFFCISCQFQTYQAKPIQAEKMAQSFEHRAITDPKFQQFLLAQGYAESELPIKNWDLTALTHCAHYFHPSLNVARAQWKAAQASEALASEKPLPTVNTTFSRSNQANQDINPFAYQFSIDIPINTQNKQHIQIESFNHLTNIAKLEIAQTAWQLHHQVALNFYEIDWHEKQISLQTKEVALKKEIAEMFSKRKQFGLASTIELSQASLQLQASQTALDQLAQQKTSLKGQLAKNLGLPLEAVMGMTISASMAKNTPMLNQDIQKSALFNRLDARIALERYAVAENKLKLEIARQYPDIVISPGLAYEFGDTVWSLGFSGLMNLLKKNKASITEAEQLREVEVAQFEALQANIMSEASLVQAQLAEAENAVQQQQKILENQTQHFAKINAQFNRGEIDRLALTLAKLELLNAEKSAALAEHQHNLALVNLENSLQTLDVAHHP